MTVICHICAGVSFGRIHRSSQDAESSRCKRSRVGVIYCSAMSKIDLQRHSSPSYPSVSSCVVVLRREFLSAALCSLDFTAPASSAFRTRRLRNLSRRYRVSHSQRLHLCHMEVRADDIRIRISTRKCQCHPLQLLRSQNLLPTSQAMQFPSTKLKARFWSYGIN